MRFQVSVKCEKNPQRPKKNRSHEKVFRRSEVGDETNFLLTARRGISKTYQVALKIELIQAKNHHGGQAELVELPKIGISGNSHFLMQEQNNEEIMKLALAWLKEKGLDK